MAGNATVKGWCPGALRPMLSGDGLVVRVRPRYAALSRDQVLALCDAAGRFGTGSIDLTNRANLQIRGVTEAGWPKLMEALAAADLIDEDAETEQRRNLLVAPYWVAGDDTHRITGLLLDRLKELPELPAKVGFAIDAGSAPLLSRDSADFRIERSDTGELLVRADGRKKGVVVATPQAAVDALITLAHWFVESGGPSVGRMRRHNAPLPDWAASSVYPADTAPVPALGIQPAGTLYGLVFGQVDANNLKAALEKSNATGVRLTPWRRLLLEGGTPGLPCKGLVLDNGAPELSADACAGAPGCDQATVPTRDLASRLSGAVAGHLHVSGCCKGCARRLASEVCVTGRDGCYDVIFNGRADGEPDITGLTASQVLEYFGVK